MANGNKERALLLMANHVRAANAIYKNTGFADESKPEGTEFVVTKAVIQGEALHTTTVPIWTCTPNSSYWGGAIRYHPGQVLSAIVKHSVPCRGGGDVSKEICGTVRLPVWRHVSRQWHKAFIEETDKNFDLITEILFRFLGFGDFKVSIALEN